VAVAVGIGVQVAVDNAPCVGDDDGVGVDIAVKVADGVAGMTVIVGDGVSVGVSVDVAVTAAQTSAKVIAGGDGTELTVPAPHTHPSTAPGAT
jgi:hypothetical protein